MIKPLISGKPPKLKKKANGRVTLTRQYELITPLFGGGSEANVVDVDNPIKGTAVRGQLRFWWRATRGGQFGGDRARMKAREDKIFGTAATDDKDEKRPLPLQIAVHINNLGSDVNPFNHIRDGDGYKSVVNRESNVPAYAAFPLQRESADITANNFRTVQKGITFTVEINFHKDYKKDVKAALWAWETFGGIGARTRRGFGALHCTSVKLRIDNKKFKSTKWKWAYSSQNTQIELANDMEEYIFQGDFPDGTPCLSRNTQRTRVTPVTENENIVWKDLVDSLRGFRQSRSLKNINERMLPFGRSHWPEPDAIRKLTGESSYGHDTPVYPVTTSDSAIDEKFPRAAFGLPIIFDFQGRANEPRKTELKGVGYERMASRLILRPLKCSDGNYVGLATILCGKIVPPDGLALKNVSKENPTQPNLPIAGAENLTAREATRIQRNHPNYNGKTDILQAFLDQLP